MIPGWMAMKKTYQGGCHCGAVRFECELDPADGSSRCNCSICAKGRFWKSIAKGDAFRILKGADALRKGYSATKAEVKDNKITQADADKKMLDAWNAWVASDAIQ